MRELAGQPDTENTHMTDPKTKPPWRRGGGGKLARSEQVSIRLDPKLRFAAELAAGKERRTLSSFIESAVERAVKEVGVTYCNIDKRHITADEVTRKVWDVDEVSRFTAMGINYPELLTHDEQKKWKFISAHDEFWVTTEPLENPYIDEPGVERLAEITAMIDAWTFKHARDPSVPEPKLNPDDWSLLYQALRLEGVRFPNDPLIRAAWDLIEAHTLGGEKFDWQRFKAVAEALKQEQAREGLGHGA